MNRYKLNEKREKPDIPTETIGDKGQRILTYADGSTCSRYSGSELWRNARGENHRLDGPAFTDAAGSYTWFKDGVEHRADGPALAIMQDGRVMAEQWYFEGKKHRNAEEGPAYIGYGDDGKIRSRQFWEHGVKCTPERIQEVKQKNLAMLSEIKEELAQLKKRMAAGENVTSADIDALRDKMP
jgi:hypothetical protein